MGALLVSEHRTARPPQAPQLEDAQPERRNDDETDPSERRAEPEEHVAKMPQAQPHSTDLSVRRDLPPLRAGIRIAHRLAGDPRGTGTASTPPSRTPNPIQAPRVTSARARRLTGSSPPT